MREIEILEALVGEGFAYNKGVHEVPAEIARDLISAGLARPVTKVEKKIKKRGQKATVNVQAEDGSGKPPGNKNRGKATSKG